MRIYCSCVPGGNGGGRNDLAQGGGKDVSKEDLVISNIKEEIKAI